METSPQSTVAASMTDAAVAVPTNGSPSPAKGENDKPSLNPIDLIDPRKVSVDVLEYYCEAVLATSHLAANFHLVANVQYMMRRLIKRQHDYGRLFNRTILTNMVARVCGRHAYAIPDGAEDGAPSSHRADDCLVHFVPAKWKEVARQFRTLRDRLLRNDASWTVLPQLERGEEDEDDESEETAPEPDDGTNEALESHPAFSESYAQVLLLVKFHSCLSHIQPHLHEAVRGEESAAIPRDRIVAFSSAIEEEFGDVRDSEHARVLSDLLAAIDRESQVSVSWEVQALQKDNEIAEIKQNRAEHAELFSLQRFQRTFLELVRRWAELALPVPELSRIGYGGVGVAAALRRRENAHGPGGGRRPQAERPTHSEDANPPPSLVNGNDDDIETWSDDEGEEGENTQVLRRKRRALMKNVTDPLDHCVAVAQCARTQHTVDRSKAQPGAADDSIDRDGSTAKAPSFQQNKTSGHALRFSSSEESDETEEECNTLSRVPAKYKPAKRARAPPVIPVSRKAFSAKKRVKFSDEEDEAIRVGIDKCGFGNWAAIKTNRTVQLGNRSAVQIKDRARTLGITG